MYDNSEVLATTSNIDDYKETFPDIRATVKKKLGKSCNRNLIVNRLPIIDWLPKYRKDYIIRDFVAGLTVALTAIPQSIAHAVIAGLEPQYGLYSAFMGCFVYFIFGSCKDIAIGPTAILSLMVQVYTSDNIDYAILITFLAGILILLLGLLNFEFLIQFLSIPVTIGFTTAAAITIASGQIKTLLGLPGKSNEFIETWKNIFLHIKEIQLWDSALGVSTIIFLLSLRKLKDVKGKWKPIAKYLSLSRYALAVIIGTILAYILFKNGSQPFTLNGPIASDFPTFQLPPFSTIVKNETLTFGDMLSNLSGSLVSIPMVAIIEIIAISKAFSKGKTVNATQELIALGLCNIFGSFFQSIPVTGLFTRTAINNASGVRTPLGGIFTGIIILLALAFLTKSIEFIPKTTLAAVIITAVMFMVKFGEAYHIWKTRRIDILPFITTFIGSLILSLEIGIAIGLGTNILILLCATSRPNTKIDQIKIFENNILIFTPDQNLVFSAAEYLKTKIFKMTVNNECNTDLVIINGEYIQSIDFTVAKNLFILVDDLKIQKIKVLFWNWKRQPIGVAWRLNKEFGNLFIKSNTIEEIVGELKLAIDGTTDNLYRNLDID